MPHEIAPDDVVRTHAEAQANERPPLLVMEPLLSFLDEHGLGDGEPAIGPIGDGHSNATYLFERGGARFVLRRPPHPPLPVRARWRPLRPAPPPAAADPAVGQRHAARGARAARARRPRA